MKENFGKWLEVQLEKKGFKRTTLAEKIGVHHTWIWRIMKEGKTPSRKVVEKIGEELGNKEEALKVAGFGEKIPQSLILTEFDLSGFSTLLEWLNYNKLYSEDEIKFIKNIIEKALYEYNSTFNNFKAHEQEFFKKFSDRLYQILENKSDEDILEPISQSIAIFVLQAPNIFVNINSENKSIKTFLSAGFIEEHDVLSNLFLLKYPICFFPTIMFHPLIEPELCKGVKTYKILSKDEKDSITSEFKKKSEMYNKLSEAERDSMWFFAKSLVYSLWKQLGKRFEVLRDSIQYYESKFLYKEINEFGVIVFSTTTGLIVPEEHYGSRFLKVIQDKSKLTDEDIKKIEKYSEDRVQKNPIRYSYFKDGIEHGCKSGCVVRYQFSLKTTAKALYEGYERAKKFKYVKEYEQESQSILVKYLRLDSLEISASDFSKQYLDWRNWLTLISDDYIVLSSRDKKTKKLAHGLLIERSFMDEMLGSNLPDWPSGSGDEKSPILSLASHLYENGKQEDNDINKILLDSKISPEDKADKVFKTLLEIGKDIE